MSDGSVPPPPPVPPPGGSLGHPTSPSFSGSVPPPPPPPPPGLTPPPGYTAYQTGPTPTGQIKRIGGVAKAAMILVAIAGLGGTISALLNASASSKASDFLDGRISASEFNDAYRSVQLLQTLLSPISLAAGIVTIVWLFRIASNVRTFGRQTTWSPLFTIFGWALPPVLNLIPFLVVRELWKASDPAAGADGVPGQQHWKASRDNPLLYIWFVVYGLVPSIVFVLTIGSVFDSFLNASGSDEIAAETLQASSSYDLLTAAATIIGAVVWVVFIKQVTARHTALTGEK